MDLTGWQRSGVWIAGLGGIGRCPRAPRTAASLAAVLVYLTLPLDVRVQAPVVLAALGLGVWSSHVAAGVSRTPDPQTVVIDEAAGMWLACFMLPKSLIALAAAFALFRLLDIAKWFPINRLERLPGGWGIMADDVAAGCLTRLLLSLWI
jgi:phosphatidylglycerophosphatase A